MGNQPDPKTTGSTTEHDATKDDSDLLDTNMKESDVNEEEDDGDITARTSPPGG